MEDFLKVLFKDTVHNFEGKKKKYNNVELQ